MPRTESTRIATAAIVTTTIVSTTRSMTIVPRIVERLRPVRSPRSWAPDELAQARRQDVVRQVPHEQRGEHDRERHGGDRGEQHPPADGPQEDVADDEGHQRATQRGSAPWSTSQAARHVHRPDDQRQGDDGDGDSQRRPPQAPAEAHGQAVPGSLAETRGRSFADRRSPVRCRR